jgi:hypothetical protein
MSTESGHWYDLTGKPCHTQPCKGKKAKSPTRNTNKTDAQRLKLLPSVSAYTKILASPGLVRDQLKEVAKACWMNPAHPGEDMDQYVEAMVEESGSKGGNAAKLGDTIHKALDNVLRNKPYEDADVVLSTGAKHKLSEFVEPALTKLRSLNLTVVSTEKVVVNSAHGYAGTTDGLFQNTDRYGVFDWKSRKTKPGKPVDPYETQPMQIAAYIAAYFGEDGEFPLDGEAEGYNIYISTTEVGRVEVVHYTYSQLASAWLDFLALARLYRTVNKWDPRITP